MTLNKKKLSKNISNLRAGRPNSLSWLSNSQSAKETAKVAGTLFFIEAGNLSRSSSRGAFGFTSSGTAEQRDFRDRMRYGRARTMRE